MQFSRQEYWSWLPFPTAEDLPDPGIKSVSLVSSALAGKFFATMPPSKPSGGGGEETKTNILEKHANVSIKHVTPLTKNNVVMRKVNTMLANLCSAGASQVGLVVKNLPARAGGRQKRHRFNTWVGKISWRRKWKHTPVFLPRESHGQRSLVGYSPQGLRVRYDWSDLAHMPSWYKWHIADTLENINDFCYNSFSYCLNRQVI